MELFTFFNSSTSYRVRIALALKGLEYTRHAVNIRAGEQKNADYLLLNPMGGVPVLCDEPQPSLGQSLAIIDYLDQRYPAPRLIPQSTLERAKVMEIALAIACDIHPVNNLRVLQYLSNELKISDEQKQNWYQHWIKEGLTAVETLLFNSNSGNFCVGNTPSLADCCLIPQWANARRMGCELDDYPRCQQIVTHCLTLPAFIAAAPENQPDYISV